MRKYFLHTDNGQEGPLSLDELKTKDLKHDTPVWHNSLEDWTHAGKIEELRDAVSRTPLPVFKESHAAIARERPLPKTVEGLPVKKSNNVMIAVIAASAVVLLVVFFLYK